MFYLQCLSTIVFFPVLLSCVAGGYYVRREVSASSSNYLDGTNHTTPLDQGTSVQIADPGAADPVNFVIHCPQDINRMDRFRRHMHDANLTFEVFPCIHPTLKEIHQAVQEGLLSSTVEEDAFYHSGTLGVGLAHMRVLQTIVNLSLPFANIFEDDEVVPSNYYSERKRVLASLPRAAEFVNFNALRATGESVDGADSRVLRMVQGARKNPMYNVWLSNYYVTIGGARKVLSLMNGFDFGNEKSDEIDWRLSEAVSSGRPLEGYVLKTNSLSIHCEQMSTKDQHDREGTSFAETPDQRLDVCAEI